MVDRAPAERSGVGDVASTRSEARCRRRAIGVPIPSRRPRHHRSHRCQPGECEEPAERHHHRARSTTRCSWMITSAVSGCSASRSLTGEVPPCAVTVWARVVPAACTSRRNLHRETGCARSPTVHSSSDRGGRPATLATSRVPFEAHVEPHAAVTDDADRPQLRRERRERTRVGNDRLELRSGRIGGDGGEAAELQADEVHCPRLGPWHEPFASASSGAGRRSDDP